MSIRDEIKLRIEEGRLFLLEPAIAGAPIDRTVLVSPAIHGSIVGPW